MKTSAKVILDSLSPVGARITTLQLVYPRFVHSELLTHRTLSRNSSSSRAIPVAKMIEQVKNDPAMPCHWGANQPGMQARAELEEKSLSYAKEYWLMAAKSAAMVAENMAEIGLHKQVANRILEPFQWMHTIVTATEWDNFFKLRAHPDADPNIYALAHEMGNAREASRPVEREFHAPYLLHDDVTIEKEMAMVSAARCARVSYLNHDGTSPSASKDLDLANKLRESGHWSPFEHVAFATPTATVRAANFKGWKSYRNQLGF